MKIKKWLLGIGILCVVGALITFYTLSHRGWAWTLPQSLLDRFDIEQLTENVDQMVADGYVDLSGSDIYHLGRADNESATPMIHIIWKKERDSASALNKPVYKAYTRFITDMRYAVGNTEGYRFDQDVRIWFDQDTTLWIVYYTKDLFGGRQQVIDYLTQFCDSYCPEK